MHILVQEANKLMEYGISKEPEKQLLEEEEVEDELESKMLNLSVNKNKDPDAKRIGIGLNTIVFCIDDEQLSYFLL